MFYTKSAYSLLLIILHFQKTRTLVVIIAQNWRAFSNKELVFLHNCFKGAQLSTVVFSACGGQCPVLQDSGVFHFRGEEHEK